jgi:hypothetical protein
VWWLYAHAVNDPQKGREALQKVSELNPNYPGLETLEEQIETPKPVEANKPTLKKLGAPTPLPPESLPDDSSVTDELDFEDDLEFDGDDFDDDGFDLEFEEDEPDQPRKGWSQQIANDRHPGRCAGSGSHWCTYVRIRFGAAG